MAIAPNRGRLEIAALLCNHLTEKGSMLDVDRTDMRPAAAVQQTCSARVQPPARSGVRCLVSADQSAAGTCKPPNCIGAYQQL